MRLSPKDRARLNAGEFLPNEYGKYIKPYGHLIIPEHLKSLREFNSMVDTILDMYDTYGIPVETMIVVDQFNGQTPKDLNSMLVREPSDGLSYELEHTILDLKEAAMKRILDKKIENLSAQDKIAFILKLAKERKQS